MAKTTKTYWNPLMPENAKKWESRDDTNGKERYVEKGTFSFVFGQF